MSPKNETKPEKDRFEARALKKAGTKERALEAAKKGLPAG
jgi:hypothetical protein